MSRFRKRGSLIRYIQKELTDSRCRQLMFNRFDHCFHNSFPICGSFYRSLHLSEAIKKLESFRGKIDDVLTEFRPRRNCLACLSVAQGPALATCGICSVKKDQSFPSGYMQKYRYRTYECRFFHRVPTKVWSIRILGLVQNCNT